MSCDTCQHWCRTRTSLNGNGFGECHRYPKKFETIYIHWCSEWKPRFFDNCAGCGSRSEKVGCHYAIGKNAWNCEHYWKKPREPLKYPIKRLYRRIEKRFKSKP